MKKKIEIIQKLFFSADDFGVSKKANRNILDLVFSGKIDRVAIMMNGAFSDKEKEELLFSKVKLDIHLDGTEKIPKERKLQEGVFFRILQFLSDYLFGEKNPRKMRIFWEKQILEFKDKFGRYPDGINSHQHIHFFPPYFKIFLELSQKYQIKFIRFGHKSLGRFNFISFILDILKKIDIFYLRKNPLPTTEFMVSADWIKDFNFKKYIANYSNSIEIIFHPERDEEFSFLKKYKKL